MALLMVPSAAMAVNGHIMHGVGAVNQSMGGVGIATSLDALGANHNNVSSIAFLGRNTVEVAVSAVLPDTSMAAASNSAYGSVDSTDDASIIPAFGAVYSLTPRWTLGLSAAGLSGFGVDYPEEQPDPSGNFNPLTLPQQYGGLGAIYSKYKMLQITGSVAYNFSDAWVIGLGLNLDQQSLALRPYLLAPPGGTVTFGCVDGNPISPCPGFGFASARDDTGAWGWGFTLGTTYKILQNVALGFVFKSPQWFQKLNWKSQYPDGTATKLTTNLDFPMIIGAGIRYDVSKPLLVAADAKWVNYSSTQGLGAGGFQTTASGPFVRGPGWQDMWVLAIGGQYEFTDFLAIRAGYNYNTNPIPPERAFFNTQSPMVFKHHVAVGLGCRLSSFTADLAYSYAFQNSQSGPFISSGGPGSPPINQAIPDTRVTNSVGGHLLTLQLSMAFD